MIHLAVEAQRVGCPGVCAVVFVPDVSVSETHNGGAAVQLVAASVSVTLCRLVCWW
jgi:hypothetical protein